MIAGTMRSDLYPELYQVEDNHWWHLQKRRLIHYLIKKYSPKPGRILDVGCGGGKLLAELQDLGWQVDGVDAPGTKALGQKRGLKIATVDLQTAALPYPKNYFDLVVCLDTLEHMRDDRRLIAEMARVTKSKGVIIISVPAYQWLFSYWDSMLGHFRRYNKSSLLKSTHGHQLKTKLVSYFFAYLLLPAIIIRLVKAVLRQKQRSDFTTNPLPVFSRGVVDIMGMVEFARFKKSPIPFGLSLVGVFEKR
jgi:2-polyprenyl-3-methyl-5-hydroxy-6-metoxy-1,4-benzoquinol methylase